MVSKYSKTLWLEMSITRGRREGFFASNLWQYLKVVICLYFAFCTFSLGQVASFQGYPAVLLLITQICIVAWAHMVYWSYILNDTSERVDILTYFWMFMLKGMVFVWYSLVISVLANLFYEGGVRYTLQTLLWVQIVCILIWSAKTIFELMPGNAGACSAFYQKLRLKQKYHYFWEIVKF